MKKLFVAILLLAGAGEYAHGGDGKGILLQKEGDSFIKFNIKHMGMSVEGEFTSFTADISYDKASPGKSRFNGTIKAESVNTGINMRDNHLRKEEYLHVDKHPEIKFQSKSTSKSGQNKLKVVGDLTIRGVTKTLELEVTVEEKSGGKMVFTATTELDRLDFGVGGKSMIMGDKVIIEIRIEQTEN